GITPRTIQRDLNVLQFNELVYSPCRGKWTTTGKKVVTTIVLYMIKFML
ncbi:hypothetical protein ACT453_40305, partial [Bacillus sp. D-CC]